MTDSVLSPRPCIGLLWGAFPWDAPPRKIGKLFSMGATARVLTRALGAHGSVVPYLPPPADVPPAAHRAALAGFLGAIDVLWADLYPASEPTLRLRHELGLACPAILFAGGTLPKGAEAMLFPWQELLRPGDGLVFTCAADRAIWRRLVRVSTLREWVVPLGVDDTIYRPGEPAARAATRARYGLPPAAPLLLYVGRLNIQKNLHGTLRLFAAVRRAVPDAHLCFAGEEDDIRLAEFGVANTGYVAWLRQLAAELGVADALTFTGPVYGAELAALYRAADLLVNLSIYHRENFGLSQAEAQACGLPVVCTDWGGFKDVVRHGATGYLVETVLTKQGIRVNWAAGAGHIIVLLRDPALRARFSAAAANRAQQLFSSGALANALSGVLADALSPAPALPVPPYTPSRFARRYEAHKRACGWNAPEDATNWRPPMFAGRDYALYETLMAPYATRLAGALSPGDLNPGWIPYFPASVTRDPLRRLVWDTDPIWPHRRFPTLLEWAVLQQIDGATAIGALIADNTSDREARLAALWRLYIEGFILFQSSDL
jgi:glycosyltransferase involved in cell wall biosynthesis